MNMFGYQEGTLPITYLGMALIPSGLKKHNCNVLVEKLTNIIYHWTNKGLSYAGRLQLIKSVLPSITLYW